MKNIINILANIFYKIGASVRKNGLLYSTWAVLLFLVLYTFVINPIDVNDIIARTDRMEKSEHDESTNKRLMADQVIPPLMENIRLRYGLTRVSLMEMHNSTQNINGVSFLYLSMIYECTADSTDYITDEYQYQRTGNFYDLFYDMRKHGYVIVRETATSEKYKRLCRKLLKNGIHSVMFVPVFNDSQRIDAVLVLSSTKPDIDAKKIGPELSNPISQIKKLLL